MDCGGIPELGYGEFGELIRKRTAGKRVPLSGSIELTFQCNLRCKHCYLDSVHDGIPGEKELDTEEWYGILDQLADAGTLWLLMTGGEPFSRPDFLDIYTYAKRKGFLITIFTNGTLITPKIADYLAEFRPVLIEISLYGRTKDTYERVTGIAGSYEKCIRGIELLQDRGLPLRLKTVVMTLNKDEFRDIAAFAEERGIEFRYDLTMFGGMNGTSGPFDYRLRPDEVIQIEKSYPGRLEELRKTWKRLTLDKTKNDKGRLYVCGAGTQTFNVDSTGKLSVCMLSRHPSYDLRHSTFAEGWVAALPEVLNRPAPEHYECNTCELLGICGSCPGKNELEDGDPGTRVEYLCTIAHLRAQIMKEDLAPEFLRHRVTN